MAPETLLHGGGPQLPMLPPAQKPNSASSMVLCISKYMKKRQEFVMPLFAFSSSTLRCRSRSLHHQILQSKTPKASRHGNIPSRDDERVPCEGSEKWEVDTSSHGSSLIVKLAVALGVAATVTILCAWFKKPSLRSSFGVPFLVNGSSTSVSTTVPVGFTLKLFGYDIFLPEHTPGWIYFWLLMAAGCGLFISEEALNIWVGISLARMLSLDGSWKTFSLSFSNNSSYIISTILWVYWGVCISDMIPFYLGQFVRQKTKAPDEICSKLGISKEKSENVASAVQKYGNLIGFVERFSLGVRNPTAFFAGAMI
ncbi:uncharacterized protein LOC18429931 isoform X2 [Amborella trichopoda]|uniref:uncharacterized protein LOC18429931 isoform X2 n=1 Tax=Amborella trichopoda TaxID=13333 RepID=UPI0009C0E8A6|nr:uncharacterized protein LOC18429931 isoform X2 [Amborella trichopoda]|eukprot:XP_020520385.1 uncharacterized protein LOC18429931 isoform X2 [Amborella trichopoda]